MIEFYIKCKYEGNYPWMIVVGDKKRLYEYDSFRTYHSARMYLATYRGYTDDMKIELFNLFHNCFPKMTNWGYNER